MNYAYLVTTGSKIWLNNKSCRGIDEHVNFELECIYFEGRKTSYTEVIVINPEQFNHIILQLYDTTAVL